MNYIDLGLGLRKILIQRRMRIGGGDFCRITNPDSNVPSETLIGQTVFHLFLFLAAMQSFNCLLLLAHLEYTTFPFIYNPAGGVCPFLSSKIYIYYAFGILFTPPQGLKHAYVLATWRYDPAASGIRSRSCGSCSSSASSRLWGSASSLRPR